jgi:hypothetical protein
MGAASTGLPCALLLDEISQSRWLGRIAPRECDDMPLSAHVSIGKSNSVIEEFNVTRHRPDVEAMLPRSGRSFAMGDLQDRIFCSYALRSPSAGRDFLLIDTKAGFCPNRIDSAKWRRLSHAFDASRRHPSRTTGLCNRGREEKWAPRQGARCDRSEMRFFDPGAFQWIVRSSEVLAHIRKEFLDGI